MAGSARANKLMRQGRDKGKALQIGSYIDLDGQKVRYMYVKREGKKLVYAVSYGGDVYISKKINPGDEVELVANKLPYGYAWIKKEDPCDFVLRDGIDWDYVPSEGPNFVDGGSSDEEEETEHYFIVKQIVNKI